MNSDLKFKIIITNQAINIATEPNAHLYAFTEDSRPIIRAERITQDMTEKGRQYIADKPDLRIDRCYYISARHLLYRPDSM